MAYWRDTRSMLSLNFYRLQTFVLYVHSGLSTVPQNAHAESFNITQSAIPSSHEKDIMWLFWCWKWNHAASVVQCMMAEHVQSPISPRCLWIHSTARVRYRGRLWKSSSDWRSFISPSKGESSSWLHITNSWLHFSPLLRKYLHQQQAVLLDGSLHWVSTTTLSSIRRQCTIVMRMFSAIYLLVMTPILPGRDRRWLSLWYTPYMWSVNSWTYGHRVVD